MWKIAELSAPIGLGSLNRHEDGHLDNQVIFDCGYANIWKFGHLDKQVIFDCGYADGRMVGVCRQSETNRGGDRSSTAHSPPSHLSHPPPPPSVSKSMISHCPVQIMWGNQSCKIRDCVSYHGPPSLPFIHRIILKHHQQFTSVDKNHPKDQAPASWQSSL